jgi:hypothetical protein
MYPYAEPSWAEITTWFTPYKLSLSLWRLDCHDVWQKLEAGMWKL